MSNYDTWKTTPLNQYDKPISNCHTCNSPLYPNQDTYYDSRDDVYFCDIDCFKKYLLKYINDELDYYIELLEQNEDTYTTQIEKEED